MDVIHSGAGADGADVLHGIREAGVTVFAQEPGTAQISTMPLNAIAGGQVDRVLSPAQRSVASGSIKSCGTLEGDRSSPG